MLETKINSLKYERLFITGGHNFSTIDNTVIEDSVAILETYKKEIMDRAVKPYNLLIIVEDFLISRNFLYSAIKLVFATREKKLLQRAIVVVKDTQTKRMAYQIIKRYLPILEMTENEQDAIHYLKTGILRSLGSRFIISGKYPGTKKKTA